MQDNDTSDRLSYAPFILIDSGKHRSLILSDDQMVSKAEVFEELQDEGWSGNGYDWNALAQVVVAEQMPDLLSELSFDSEAGMFSAGGSREALERLGQVMASVFHNDESIRDL